MVISAILVGLLATCGQWWFFGPITKCLVYPLTTGTLVGVFTVSYTHLRAHET